MAIFGAIKSLYIKEGLWSAAKEVPVQGWGYVKEQKGKTIAISLAAIAVASLTAAYFLSPVYATFVGTVTIKAATLVSPAITAMSAFAVAYPLIASLVVLAAVAALIAVPVYACKNSNKLDKIEEIKQEIKTVYYQYSQGSSELGENNNNKAEITEVNVPLSVLNEIAIKLGVPLHQV